MKLLLGVAIADGVRVGQGVQVCKQVEPRQRVLGRTGTARWYRGSGGRQGRWGTEGMERANSNSFVIDECSDITKKTNKLNCQKERLDFESIICPPHN